MKIIKILWDNVVPIHMPKTFGELAKEITTNHLKLEDVELLCQICRKPMKVVPIDFRGRFDVKPCDHVI